MGGKVGGEDSQGTSNQCYCSIGMTARTASVHVVQTTVQPRHAVSASLATSQSSQIVSDGGKPIDARTTLAGALVGQVAGYSSRLGHAARRFSEYNDHPDAGRSADRAQGDGGIGSLKVFWPHPGPAVPTDQ